MYLPWLSAAPSPMNATSFMIASTELIPSMLTVIATQLQYNAALYQKLHHKNLQYQKQPSVYI